MLGGDFQKSGNNGVNQQASNGGIAQNATGDITNHFGDRTNDKDLGILSEIFNYAQEKINEDEKNISNPNDGKITELKKKVELNFEGIHLSEVKNLIQHSWRKMGIIEEFVQKMTDSNGLRIDSLIVFVQDLFKEKRQCIASNESINGVEVINAMAKGIIPTGKDSNPDYFGNAVAVILYFFQMCEIGAKTEIEAKASVTFLD